MIAYARITYWSILYIRLMSVTVVYYQYMNNNADFFIK